MRYKRALLSCSLQSSSSFCTAVLLWWRFPLYSQSSHYQIVSRFIFTQTCCATEIALILALTCKVINRKEQQILVHFISCFCLLASVILIIFQLNKSVFFFVFFFVVVILQCICYTLCQTASTSAEPPACLASMSRLTLLMLLKWCNIITDLLKISSKQ